MHYTEIEKMKFFEKKVLKKFGGFKKLYYFCECKGADNTKQHLTKKMKIFEKKSAKKFCRLKKKCYLCIELRNKQ